MPTGTLGPQETSPTSSKSALVGGVVGGVIGGVAIMTAIVAFTWYRFSRHRRPPPPQPNVIPLTPVMPDPDTPAPKPTIGEDVPNVEPMRENRASVALRYPDPGEEMVSGNTARDY